MAVCTNESSANYWLVVFEEQTGAFKNVDITFTPGATEEDIKTYYSGVNSGVRVISCGEGVENRPFALQGLEFI